MTAPPARNDIGGAGNPSRATAKTAFTALYDYVTGLLGASGDAPDARTALGAGSIGSAVFTAATKGAAQAAIGIPRGHIDGVNLSTAGSSATMTISAGQAADSTATVLMDLASSLAKTTSAWAVGAAGGLDTGTIANNTWYHFYLIRRPDSGVVDALISLSATSPTLPANYTQFRRIGSGRTNGSAQWVSFTQVGDYFRWAATVADVAAASPGASAVSRTLTVPTGVKVKALLAVGVHSSGGVTQNAVYLSDLAASDEAAVSTAATAVARGTASHQSSNAANVVQCEIVTNTSAQIRSRMENGVNACTLVISTIGWTDARGKA